jgi:hypothetical protein
MTVTSPLTEMRGVIAAALDAEFAPEGITFASDKMHPAMGLDGPVGAIYPDAEVPRGGREIEAVNTAYVQVFAKWEKQVDPAQVFDPSLVEGWAARLQVALKAVQDVQTATTWFFTVKQIDYLDDPTGNRSRFLARVQGSGQNQNLLETGP